MRHCRSSVGSYAGYGATEANGYRRTSCYVPAPDGCRLAIDILHPTWDGYPLSGPRPTVLRATPYRRAFLRGKSLNIDASRAEILRRYPPGSLITAYELVPVARELIHQGYVFVSMDLRGTGASFGIVDQPVTPQIGQDIAHVIDWIAAQPWSDGQVGVWGRSWEALVQFPLAVISPKPLKCYVAMAVGAIMESTWYNGLFAMEFRWSWTQMRAGQDGAEVAMPVDGPDGVRLRDEAMQQRAHLYKWDSPEAMARAFQSGEFASHWIKRMHTLGVADHPPLERPRLAVEQIDAINAAGVPAYLLSGWWDLNFSTTTISLYRALRAPKKLTIGPWTHAQYAFPLEPVRWFDHWLRGIDNGVQTEPPVHYAVTERSGRVRWRQGEDFPPPHAAMRVLHLAGGTTDGQAQLTDGRALPASLQLTFDPRATTGRGNRTNYLFEKSTLWYSGLKDREGVGLRFDSLPLRDDVEISGAPFLSVEVASDQPLGALFAILEQVAPNGSTSYITEGLLNLEYRGEFSYWPTYIGRAQLGQFPQDARPVIPGEPLQIGLDLLAVCRIVPKGDCLRLTLTTTDFGNWWTPPSDPPFTLSLSVGGPNGATLSLPITPHPEGASFVDGLFLDDTLEYAFEPSTWVTDTQEITEKS